MALPSSGQVRLGADVNVELGNSASAQISLGQSTVRTLYGVSSGAIRLAADGYGKANRVALSYVFSSNTADPVTIPPHFRINFAAATIVPPVASTSSIIKTFSPGSIASL